MLLNPFFRTEVPWKMSIFHWRNIFVVYSTYLGVVECLFTRILLARFDFWEFSWGNSWTPCEERVPELCWPGLEKSWVGYTGFAKVEKEGGDNGDGATLNGLLSWGDLAIKKKWKQLKCNLQETDIGDAHQSRFDPQQGIGFRWWPVPLQTHS